MADTELHTVVLRFFPARDDQEILKQILEQEKNNISSKVYNMLASCLEQTKD